MGGFVLRLHRIIVKIGDKILVNPKQARLGSVVRSSSKSPFLFRELTVPPFNSLTQVTVEEGPYALKQNGVEIEIARVSFLVTRIVKKDLWIDLTSLGVRDLTADDN